MSERSLREALEPLAMAARTQAEFHRFQARDATSGIGQVYLEAAQRWEKLHDDAAEALAQPQAGEAGAYPDHKKLAEFIEEWDRVCLESGTGDWLDTHELDRAERETIIRALAAAPPRPCGRSRRKKSSALGNTSVHSTTAQ